jgi:hypothetical protein
VIDARDFVEAALNDLDQLRSRRFRPCADAAWSRAGRLAGGRIAGGRTQA